MTLSASAIRPGGRLVDAMRQLAGGVCVITAGQAPTRTGYTGTAVFSLSVDPERVAISVGRGSSSYKVIRDTGAFGLNILRLDQQPIADRFAGRGGVKGERHRAGHEFFRPGRGARLRAQDRRGLARRGAGRPGGDRCLSGRAAFLGRGRDLSHGGLRSLLLYRGSGRRPSFRRHVRARRDWLRPDYKTSGVLNFAQGPLLLFAALTYVSLVERGVSAPLAPRPASPSLQL